MQYTGTKQIRQAIRESSNGRGNVYVFGNDEQWHRIYDVKEKRALAYGKALNSGKWIVFREWDVR